MITLDFETYSDAGYYLKLYKKPLEPNGHPPTKTVLEGGAIRVTALGTSGGLSEVGVYPYVGHPSFEILCMHYRDDHGRFDRLWKPGDSYPHYLLRYIMDGGPIEAHNAGFEFVVWNVHCAPTFGWPALKLEQLYCSAAKCRRYSLPGALGLATQVMGGVQKDKAGIRLIQKLTRPHTPTKSRPQFRWTPETAPEEFTALYEYCAVDTAAEQGLSRAVPDLTPYERNAWLTDQRINNRGVYVDQESLTACLRLLRESDAALTAEFCLVTGGAVETVNENAKFKDWLASRGTRTESVDKSNVERMLALYTIPPDVRRALELRQLSGGANNKKLYTVPRRLSEDGRLRCSYIYCGADRTGRWSSRGVQLQNVRAGGPKTKICALCDRILGADAKQCECEWPGFHPRGEWGIEEMEQALRDVRMGDFKTVTKLWGADVGALLSGCLRGLFVAPPGHTLICADFSAIEAVALACLARCQWRIDIFNTHGKIYETTASQISGVPLEEILNYKKQHGQHHPYRKKLGKIPELASGYGGWISAWKQFGADDFFESDDEIKQAIITWRNQSPEIVEFWGGQHRQTGEKPWHSVPELYGLEGAAVAALLNPGRCYQCNDVGYGYHPDRDVLFCRLPSGRCLHYHRARLTPGEDHFRRPAYRITFEGYNSNPGKGQIGWITMETYAGRLAENVTQAVSADIQAEALVRAETAGFPVVMHTHDEVTAEVPDGTGLTLDGLVEVMQVRPTWAAWWPIRAAGWAGHRYRKD